MPLSIIPISSRPNVQHISSQKLRSIPSGKNPSRPKVKRLSREDLRSICGGATSSRVEDKHFSRDDLRSTKNSKNSSTPIIKHVSREDVRSIRSGKKVSQNETNAGQNRVPPKPTDSQIKTNEQSQKRSLFYRKRNILFKIGILALILALIGAVIFLVIGNLRSNTSSSSSSVSSNTNTSSNTTNSTVTSTSSTTTLSSTTTAMPLYRWNSTGTTVAGDGSSAATAAANLLDHPFNLVLDSSNTLYIADQQNNRIQQWPQGTSTGTTVAGDSTGALGTNSSDLNQPSAVLRDSSGNIYVADTGNNRVQFWSSGASSGTTIAGILGSVGSSNIELADPYGIALDSSSGTIYIVDQSNHRVMSYLSGASSGTVVAGGNGPGTGTTQLNFPVGLYFDSSSNSLIIANADSHNIVRWVIGASSWTLVAGSLTGISGSTSTLLQYPVGITLDSMGNLYVADRDNHRVQLFLAGQTNGTTIAGVTGQSGLNSTFLNTPCSIALDAQRNLYVADTYNNRVQRFIRY